MCLADHGGMVAAAMLLTNLLQLLSPMPPLDFPACEPFA
jgi:hypothetical protein